MPEGPNAVEGHKGKRNKLHLLTGPMLKKWKNFQKIL